MRVHLDTPLGHYCKWCCCISSVHETCFVTIRSYATSSLHNATECCSVSILTPHFPTEKSAYPMTCEIERNWRRNSQSKLHVSEKVVLQFRYSACICIMQSACKVSSASSLGHRVHNTITTITVIIMVTQ